MRSRPGVFWYSLGLTLLLLLPLIGLTAFLVHQRQEQNVLRQAAAERGGLPVEQGAQDSWRMLLVVQQEEPAFVVARVDGPAQTVTLCALPGNLQVAAPAGTTTLADCALSAGAGRAAQLLSQTIATGETAVGELYYLAATPACWQDCVGSTATARLDTAALLSKEQRTEIGYGEDSVAEFSAADAPELIATLQGALDTAGRAGRCAGRRVGGLCAAESRSAGRHAGSLAAVQCPHPHRPHGHRAGRPGKDAGLSDRPAGADRTVHHGGNPACRAGDCPHRGGDEDCAGTAAINKRAAWQCRRLFSLFYSWRNRERNSTVRGFWGCSKISAGVPSSAMTPSAM